MKVYSALVLRGWLIPPILASNHCSLRSYRTKKWSYFLPTHLWQLYTPNIKFGLQIQYTDFPRVLLFLSFLFLAKFIWCRGVMNVMLWCLKKSVETFLLISVLMSQFLWYRPSCYLSFMLIAYAVLASMTFITPRLQGAWVGFFSSNVSCIILSYSLFSILHSRQACLYNPLHSTWIAADSASRSNKESWG